MSDRLQIISADINVAEIQKIEDELKKLVIQFGKVIQTGNEVNKLFKKGTAKEFTTGIKQLKTATDDFVKSQKKMAESLTSINQLERQVAQMLRDQSRAIRDVAAATRDESRAREAAERITTQQQRTAREAANAQAAQNRASREAANAATAESRSRQQATREANANTRANQQNTSAHAQFTRQVREARQRARDYGAEIESLRNRLRAGTISQRDFRSQLSQLERNFRTATTEGNRLQRQLNRINQATTPSGNRNGSLWGRVTDIVKAAGIINVAQNVASSFFNLGEKAAETTIKLGSLRLAQASVFKTQENVGKQNLFLTEIADRYGIEIIGLSDAYTKFAASAQGTFLEGAKTQEIFDSVTRSSSLLGVSTDDTTGILRALGQMMSKGKVQAEELRGQLGDRMAGAFKLFADGMGVSTAELDAMLKKGEVLADEVLPKFAEQLNKKYKLDLGDQVNTETAAINHRTNAWVAFVDNVNSGSGIMTKSILGYNNVLTAMLEALTPNKQVTIIEKEQADLNMLGYELRKNFNDEKKRKEILQEMIDINPFFVNGLDKEHLSLSEINKQLQNVNQQYAQKIALEKQGEQIKSLLDDQAQAYIYLSRIFSDNIVDYNNFNNATRKAIDDFRDGAITYGEATKIVEKNTKSLSRENRVATDMLWRLDDVLNNNILNFDGFNRGIRGNEKAIREASAEANNMVNVFERMAGAQKQLVFMNGLTSRSFNSLGKEQKDQFKEAGELLKKAELEGHRYASVRNIWRQQNKNGTWSTTNKRESDGWYLDGEVLKMREKTKILEKEEKQKAATLSAAQKDYINILTGQRDTEIAILKEKRLNLLIGEEQYWKDYQKILENYSSKITTYLKGRNAKEIQVEGSAYRKGVEAKEKANKELYDIRSKNLEEQGKIELNILERQSSNLEENDYLSNSERLNQQIEIDNKIIKQLSDSYKKQIELAEKAAQPTIELERKRDEEIGKIQDERLRRLNALPEALNNDIDRITSLSDNLQNKDYEEQRLAILQKKITLRDREYILNQLDLEANKTALLNQRNTLELKKSELDKISETKKLTKEQEVQYSEILATIGNINSELDVTAKNLEQLQIERLLEDLKPLQSLIGDSLNDLGLDNVSKQFDEMFEKIVSGTFTAKDAVILAASAIADGLTAINNKSKENTIANLDEQLKHTQETTEQEIGFINGRLEQLNSLETLTEEQMSERNRLEDEARTYKEQQMQREKMIEAQKARAEQKAAAQQALINGALAATMTLAQMGFIAGAIPAGLALAFGIAQSVAISSRDPIPKYRVGRRGGNAEVAITQDGGREFISNERGEITSLGSDKGDQLTYLKKGDSVHTAKETKAIISRMGALPKIGDNIFQKIALQSLCAPAPVVINQNIDNSDAIAEKVGRKFENALKKYDKPVVIKNGGKIILYRGANLGLQIGEYDENGNEKYYS